MSGRAIGGWQVNDPEQVAGHVGAVHYGAQADAGGGGGGPGGGGSNGGIIRAFPTPRDRLWPTFATRAFPFP